MEKLLINHKRQLLFTTVICLFSLLAVSSGRILINFLEVNNRFNEEKCMWLNFSQNIESELTPVRQKEWHAYAESNPEIFLRANTSEYLNINKSQEISGSKNIVTNSFKSILANIVVTTKNHIKKVIQ